MKVRREVFTCGGRFPGCKYGVKIFDNVTTFDISDVEPTYLPKYYENRINGKNFAVGNASKIPKPYH
jgi:hypothetical protein